MKTILTAALALGAVLAVSTAANALCACPMCYVQPGTPGTPVFEPVTYSTDNASTTPGFAGVSGGNMSDGAAAGGARIANKGLAGVSAGQWCQRDGRSKASVDTCLKLASH